ncbi:TPA: hypothetical protein U0A13_004974 [Escherichia coli]|nr:hypothetical protein [Escherichia coli]HEL8012958.1 hypothetical protein [Escherichia coli]HEM0101807.1 hypothetical protein [Escherichia coli]HEM0849381.1 hypothetical protein [Escherichia coli]
MYWKQLTFDERKRIAEAYAAQAEALQLSDVKKLPREVKRKTRSQVLRMIFAERQARAAKAVRTREYRAAEETFTWQPMRRR